MSLKSRSKYLPMETESLITSFTFLSKAKGKLILWMNPIELKSIQVQAVNSQNHELSSTVNSQPRLKISPQCEVQPSLKIPCYSLKVAVQFYLFILRIGSVLICCCSEYTELHSWFPKLQSLYPLPLIVKQKRPSNI